MLDDLEMHRIRSHRVVITLLWLHVPFNVGVFLLVGAPWLWLGLATLASAALATATWRLASSQAAIRVTNAVAFMATISLLLAGMRGHPWQADVHMYYFAALALIAIYCDPIAIAAASAIVAVHHLFLNYVLPSAVYPGDSDFGRVVLHAAILVIATAGLISMSQMIKALFQQSRQAREAAEAAQAKAEAASDELRSTQAAERKTASAQTEYQERVSVEQNAVVGALADSLVKIANGDLTARIEAEFEGQYRQIKTNFNLAIGKLEEALHGVRDGAKAVRSRTHEISTGSADLSQRTERQAASLQETAKALDEITVTVQKSAEGANQARHVVATADQDAKKNSAVVQEAAEAMDAIARSSHQIGQIIGVIDEIAFQTNLLALNAGVEAARAGESGRGFAVVAAEVRALALRSAQAAKEIKELISTSGDQVDLGVKLVGETGGALRRIMSQVAEVNGVVAAIANGAKDQAIGLAEINAAINQMDHMTQKNASVAAEATAASLSLSEESEKLSGLIGQFRVRDAGAARTRAA